MGVYTFLYAKIWCCLSRKLNLQEAPFVAPRLKGSSRSVNNKFRPRSKGRFVGSQIQQRVCDLIKRSSSAIDFKICNCTPI